MKPAETFIYVGGTLGLVGGCDQDTRKTFVRQSDYMTLQDDVARLTLLYTKALNEVAVKEAEVERLNVVIGLEQKTIRNLQQTPEWSEITRLTAYCRDLQAEVGRLRASSFVTAVPVEEYEKLKAEVERLRKAGDAMAKRTEFFQKRWDVDELCQEVEAWNAAKEGKQS